MPRAIDTLAEIAAGYEAIVLDQWGVLHDGSCAYPGSIAALAALGAAGTRLAVLSNSGRRAAANAARLERMGFAADLFEAVMTSGEALWRDVASGRVRERRFVAVGRRAGDAADWAKGLDIELADTPSRAEAVLLIGLPDDAGPDACADLLADALRADLPLYCANPDRASPRAGGARVMSPGALAHAYAGRGGRVHFYGKPHRPLFDALARALSLEPARLLMVGDSLEHDVAGARAAGWSTLLVQGGLHREAFAAGAAPETAVRALAAANRCPLPDFVIPTLR